VAGQKNQGTQQGAENFCGKSGAFLLFLRFFFYTFCSDKIIIYLDILIIIFIMPLNVRWQKVNGKE